MARLSKNLRLIQLSKLFEVKRHYVTAKTLAQEFGVTERTIYRDIADLGDLGYFIYNDGRGYKLDRSPPIKSWSLSPSDVRTLKLFLHSSPLSKHEDYKHQINHLIQKLKSLAHSEQVFESTPIQSAESSPSIHRQVKLKQLEQSLSRQQVCELLYQSLYEHTPRRRIVHPYAMAIREGKW